MTNETISIRGGRTGGIGRRLRGGFTLTELLVVLGIIVLLALAAVPAIRFIMGSRSVESAQNLVGAMVSLARNQAVTDNGTRGVFFFVDPANDRTTMALVAQTGAGDLGQYSGWTTGSAARPVYVDRPGGTTPPAAPPALKFMYYAPPGNAPATTSVVIDLGTGYQGTTEAFKTYLGAKRAVMQEYTCIQTHNPAAPNYAGTNGGQPFWGLSNQGLDLVAGTDFQLLPAGVGLQVINSNPAGVANFDRYLRIGCILFDGKGRFTSVPWSVPLGTTIGQAMRLKADLDLTKPPGALAPGALVSGFGVVLYDRQSFLAQAGASEGDFIFSPSGSGKTFFDIPPTFPANWTDEQNEENWIDSNSLPLLINRYDGTIIKGE
jgi:prepilin-type N-terminal cleavage/methylation domain-containing protein